MYFDRGWNLLSDTIALKGRRVLLQLLDSLIDIFSKEVQIGFRGDQKLVAWRIAQWTSFLCQSGYSDGGVVTIMMATMMSSGSSW